jgi:hypothetical protein
MTDIKDTLAERGQQYGVFGEHARVVQRLKTYYRSELTKRGKTMLPDQFEALDMIMHKIGRIVNGNSNYADSWHDIAGYATLVADRLHTEQGTANGSTGA